MARIGDVEVTVTSESIRRSNEVTDRKVEDGSISDNVKKMPEIVDISGVVGKDGWPRLQILLQYYREGKLISYVGRNSYNNLVIETLDTDHPYSARTGFKFTCTLKQIRVAKGKQVTFNVPKAIKPSVKKTTNAGKQTTKPKPVKGVAKKAPVAKKRPTMQKPQIGMHFKPKPTNKADLLDGIGLTSMKSITLDKYRF